MAVSAHHYVFDVVPLLDKCMHKLQTAIDQDLQGRHDALYDMKHALVSIERLLHRYLSDVVGIEQRRVHSSSTSSGISFLNANDNKNNNLGDDVSCLGILDITRNLKKVLEEKQRQQELHNRQKYLNPQDPVPAKPNSLYNSGRSGTDTLLFRLIVALQLCLVRIDDAFIVMTGRRIDMPRESKGRNRMFLLTGCCCIAIMGTGFVAFSNQHGNMHLVPTAANKKKDGGDGSEVFAFGRLAKVGTSLIIGRWINSRLKAIWMADKITRSTNELEEWIKQWQLVQTTDSPKDLIIDDADHFTSKRAEKLVDDKSRRLIEYAMKNNPKSDYFWFTQGDIRFLMCKRFMDVYYASVGTAIDTNQTSKWQLPLVTGAAASFYSLTGASEKASQVVSKASRDLIQHAWGMVSLPAIKNLALQASRLLKGASVADRIVICGVPCFILSREPAPELAAALKQQNKRKTPLVSRMSTISESEVHSLEEESSIPFKNPKKFAGSCGRYRQRDVVFHLTGGGFFAHTIASDIPYLLDWSESTGAVVICPEYALLPEHAFPVALDQITSVYSALVQGETVTDLGFEVNRIVVTGESVGGNLATALCVKLGLRKVEAEETLNASVESVDSNTAQRGDLARLPDALMLSCAALNLSLELSHSRILGTQDPVLPSGLISAISEAYLPPGLDEQDPLASPFFAPDSVLQLFPPVLMFAGSNDPLLDDSVTFNERLRCLGVESELRAAHNMPHAYWGLGLAGFPEAQEVQQECQEWLTRRLR